MSDRRQESVEKVGRKVSLKPTKSNPGLFCPHLAYKSAVMLHLM